MSADSYSFPPPGFSPKNIERRVKREAMRWLRHKADCPSGKHCEDPFCQLGRPCNCGLAQFLDGVS